MKILKILLAIILLLVIIFFAKGLMTPTVSYDCEITVNKKADESWAVMSDEVNLPKWINGFKRTELVSGTANTVGAVSNVYVDEGGTEMMMKETINKITPNSLLDMTFTMDFMDMDYVMTLSEKNNSTTIKTKSTTKGNSLIAKSIVSFMPSAMKAQEQENLNNLKKLIEGNTKNYFPDPEPEPTENLIE